MQAIRRTIRLEDVRQGSDEVLRQVYEENRDKFLNFARRYDLPEEENVDVYQDAFIIFHDNVMSGKLETLTSSISTYLFSIGKYLIFDRMRKNKKTVGSQFNMDIVKDEDHLIENLDIEEGSLTSEQQLLRKHFDSLGKKCQELLTLFYYRGYTIQEIMEAEHYNSENVVKSAKSRCLKSLKERIAANSM
ncbi:sigma-70 family RNA polymerase sigma factor [Flavobacteriaceae bacterium TP-CH-4]|uniref:Sigma-70 family RNA polymerase sigma factor n=1 Tax=Pelagihabitans pacificus TaxID=2696054 RepID=A0A967B3N8_9FLAO|nr:sigma-70 family RNA polymerase sigma factor [Pelagihabitans pacificus]NHF61451.1 sigma-70 family RNA polymerase sigma factor [Pelagihabitans pacificus]